MSDPQYDSVQRQIERVTSSSLSRRTLLRRGGALGGVALFGGALGGLLSACGGSSAVDEVVPTPTTAPGQTATSTTAPSGGGASTPSGGTGSVERPVYTGDDAAARRIRKLIILTQPQANVPEEYEAIQLAVSQIRQLGIDIEAKVVPWEQMSDIVWFDRQKWDMTAWQMVGRPERLDPDEFIYNLFHSSTAADGYNFVGYESSEYDELAEAQRVELDRDKRQEIIYKLQEVINEDQPYFFFVYPHENFAYNAAVWDESTIVEARGIGIKNFWTFIGATPKGNQKDMILNTLSVVQAINPLYISGGVDSWITELIWDRLMRIDASGLPQPWAAEKVEWVDGTTVVCTLRDGMTWHDGQPVTVDDVVFSFEAPAGNMSPMYKPFVSNIEAVTAVDDKTVQFKLKNASAAFETSGLAKLNIIPKHIWEPILADLESKGQNAETYQEETPIGSGPFKFVNWKQSEEIVLAANTDHWSAPKMERWILRDVPNVAAGIGGLQSGELNFLSEYTGDPEILNQAVEQNSDLKLVSTIVVGFRFLAPNHRRAPMDDVAFRRAIQASIGIDQIVKNIYKGFATIADSHVSKALEFWHNPNLKSYGESDIDTATQILIDAGYEWDSEGFLLYPAGKTETLKPEV